jgi:hypothetical protein
MAPDSWQTFSKSFSNARFRGKYKAIISAKQWYEQLSIRIRLRRLAKSLDQQSESVPDELVTLADGLLQILANPSLDSSKPPFDSLYFLDPDRDFVLREEPASPIARSPFTDSISSSFSACSAARRSSRSFSSSGVGGSLLFDRDTSCRIVPKAGNAVSPSLRGRSAISIIPSSTAARLRAHATSAAGSVIPRRHTYRMDSAGWCARRHNRAAAEEGSAEGFSLSQELA